MVALAHALRSVARPKQLAINARIRVEVLRNAFNVMNEVFVGRITKGVARNRRSYKLPGLPMANF